MFGLKIQGGSGSSVPINFIFQVEVDKINCEQRTFATFARSPYRDMQAAALSEIKRALKTKNEEELVQLCLRLGRFKKDNKELLTYLLFEMNDEAGYVSSIKNYIDDAVLEINTSHLYYAKKGIRKVLRTVNKMIRYSGDKQTEVEVLIHFCRVLIASEIEINRSKVLTDLIARQVIKIKKAMTKLHEDLQADYLFELEKL